MSTKNEIYKVFNERPEVKELFDLILSFDEDERAAAVELACETLKSNKIENVLRSMKGERTPEDTKKLLESLF